MIEAGFISCDHLFMPIDADHGGAFGITQKETVNRNPGGLGRECCGFDGGPIRVGPVAHHQDDLTAFDLTTKNPQALTNSLANSGALVSRLGRKQVWGTIVEHFGNGGVITGQRTTQGRHRRKRHQRQARLGGKANHIQRLAPGGFKTVGMQVRRQHGPTAVEDQQDIGPARGARDVSRSPARSGHGHDHQTQAKPGDRSGQPRPPATMTQGKQRRGDPGRRHRARAPPGPPPRQHGHGQQGRQQG